MLKHCINIKQFKTLYKNTFLKGYVDVYDCEGCGGYEVDCVRWL